MSARRQATRQLFSNKLRVHYGQAYVVPVERVPYGFMEDCFLGQSNGLCGAATGRHLFLITGLHTGRVGFTVDLVANAPRLDRSWDDVVEVSLFVDATGVVLQEWGGGNAYPLALAPGWYRVRYHARGMDAGREADTLLDRVIDEYWLLFWPQSRAPDAILKQTSQCAAYWHGVASALPPPSSTPPEPAALAAARPSSRKPRATRGRPAPRPAPEGQIEIVRSCERELARLRHVAVRIRGIVDRALLESSPPARNLAPGRRQSRP